MVKSSTVMAVAILAGASIAILSQFPKIFGQECPCIEGQVCSDSKCIDFQRQVFIDLDDVDVQGTFVQFNNLYTNKTANPLNFQIIMQVTAPDGVVTALQFRDFALKANEVGSFQWNFIFLPKVDGFGIYNVQFFAWDSNNDAISGKQTVSINFPA